MKTTTVLLCGVGGQGTILAADLLAKTAAASGFDVKVSEIHGMSQRGGSVTTIVRFGEEVHTMVADPGYADRIVAFESTEALRNLQFLAPEGTLLVNDEAIPSLPVQIGMASMPNAPQKALVAAGATMILATRIAQDVQNPKGANVALVGALSASLPFEEDTWLSVIATRVPPKTVAANIDAFRAGREAASCA
jgi:indolepyruvate ferredoxin oxidoreductase, beta subunit